ncbi:alpha/beta hydrolase [Cellulomonas sp. P22]|uniref:alpha/beta hydrolase n=1 Tax=Cellulomonas sp. P22 TaxID=3373189 RepID=UPI0037BBBCC4
MDPRDATRRALRLTHRIAPPLAAVAATALFDNPAPRARVWSIERDPLAQAEVRRHRVGRHQVHSYHWGDGARPVLLVHGWQARASRWAPLAAALTAEGLSPVAFDAPGHGESTGRSTDVPRMSEVVLHLAAQTGPLDALVAHSFGALAATHALRQGVPAARFVALAPVADPEHLLQTFSEQLDLHPRVTAGVRRRIARTQPVEDPWRALAVDRGPLDPTLPVLVIHDEQDHVVPVEHGRRMLAAHADHGRMLTTHGLDHQRMLTSPEVIEAVVEFVVAGQQVDGP